jgi:tRNA-specific 2-thiouridylase
MTKQQARELAGSHGFLNADRPDSQDICFVPDGDYAAFIERRLQRAFPPGDFVSPDGRVLGRHKGIIHYTVGQRRGLGVPAETKLYVSAVDPDANTVTLVREEDLMIDIVVADRVNILSGEAFEKPFHGLVRLRYRQPERPAGIVQDGDRLIIRFDAPQRAPAPGQAAVVYDEDGETVLAGGTIVCSRKERLTK